MPFEFQPLAIPGLVLVQPKVFPDERGFFLEVYQFQDFFAAGIRKPFVQANHSLSRQGTLRGLHYQKRPLAQAKLVRVLKGEIYDVAVDLRKGSPWYGQHVALTLTAGQRQMFYIPEGFAHGFLTISAEAEVEYFCSEVYSPANERGVLFSDPDLGIRWPLKDPAVSVKDGAFPSLKNADHNFIYEK